MRDRLAEANRSMYPGAFAMSMATGIISIGFARNGKPDIGAAFQFINSAILLCLSAVFLIRLVRSPRAIGSDLTDHWRGAGFFTIPAAFGVYGVQNLEFHGPIAISVGCWWVVLFSACFFTVAFFGMMVIGKDQVDIHYSINGAWLTSVVATEGLAILTVALDRVHGIPHGLGFIGGLCFASAGAMLYLVLIGSIFFRLICHPVRAADFSPPYWVNMGATMITSLAFSRLALEADAEMIGPIKMIAILYWAFGVWWIPILLALGIWRHWIEKYPLSYDPRLWSLVFPLGMFSVSTHSLSLTWQADGLANVSRIAIWVAAFTWAFLMVGYVRFAFRNIGADRSHI
ncbi:MAG TPA: tellurite resistance/C4-dicarboxylate transporter family protein [Fimbriimonadaceae bacterium]|nr:tellurite resistance/C4-dicarboxylate transporter family protein [Fimbriimonadaceae bacterium]